jgi:hypothetical protein
VLAEGGVAKVSSTFFFKTQLTFVQCCRSMKFWYRYGSGSADSYLWLMYPDPAIFVSDPQDVNKNY